MVESLLDVLKRDLAAVSFVQGTETTELFEEQAARARRLLEVKLGLELRRPADAPPVVVISGGTNVGKSSVFNWVVGAAVASSSPLARHTKAPTVYCHQAEVGALCDGAFLPAYRRLFLADPKDASREADGAVAYFLKTHAQDEVRGVVLIDSPDIDSTHARNRAVAEDLLFLADAVVFVATPEKYNDDLCVRYLRAAAELQKTLVCVLNKGADEAVRRDFEEAVVPAAGAEATVVTLPYLPRSDPAAPTPFRAELRAAVLRPRDGAARLRQAALRGAMHRLGQDLDRLSSRLREELSELDRIRSEVVLVLDARRDEYAAFLQGLDFYELDRVFERVLAYFKIPVIDDVYEGFRSAVGFVSSGLSRLVTGRPEVDARTAKLQARAEQDRQKAKELLEAARAQAMELPYRHTGTLRSSVEGWIQALKATPTDEVNRDVEAFQARAQAEAEAWIERETRRHVELLEKHPYARNALRAVKGFFQVGFGLLSAKLTGGFGPWDILIGTATERATKTILESAGGFVHYQALKAEFVATRAALFRALLEQSAAVPMRAVLPGGVEPDRLERIARAAALLRKADWPALTKGVAAAAAEPKVPA